MLTDVELAQWLVAVRHDAAAASMAAAIATGDQQTLDHLATAADVKKRRAEWLGAKVHNDDPRRTG
jgi:hypothetical protein